MKKILFFACILLLFAIACTKESLTLSKSNSNLTTNRTTYSISGNVIWEHDDVSPVAGVTVSLTGPETQAIVTDAFGYYEFAVNTAGNYTVTPSKLLNLTNGLDTADVSVIQRHITNIVPINDPYKRIAADVNKNNTISTIDASLIGQAILGNPAALAQLAPSWKFVDASYVLVLPPTLSAVPTGYPQSISFVVSSNVSGLNFIGIKRGDVNGTANPQN